VEWQPPGELAGGLRCGGTRPKSFAVVIATAEPVAGLVVGAAGGDASSGGRQGKDNLIPLITLTEPLRAGPASGLLSSTPLAAAAPCRRGGGRSPPPALGPGEGLEAGLRRVVGVLTPAKLAMCRVRPELFTTANEKLLDQLGCRRCRFRWAGITRFVS